MPIPKEVAVFNKYVANRFFLLFAGSIPPFAIVNHRGRKSSRSYRTPILGFPTMTGFIFALTYGRNVDWVKNLIASDGGILEYKGEETPICEIQICKMDDVKEIFPYWIRLSLSIISIEDCVLVENVRTYYVYALGLANQIL
jgi:hypothetical protein